MPHTLSGGSRSPSPVIFPLPLVMMSNISPSRIPLSVAGSRQSFIVSFIDSTISPLPSPAAPWHMEQSYPNIFFAEARTSGVEATGFFRSPPAGFAASAGGFPASVAAGFAASAAGGGLSFGFSCVGSCLPKPKLTTARNNTLKQASTGRIASSKQAELAIHLDLSPESTGKNHHLGRILHPCTRGGARNISYLCFI